MYSKQGVDPVGKYCDYGYYNGDLKSKNFRRVYYNQKGKIYEIITLPEKTIIKTWSEGHQTSEGTYVKQVPHGLWKEWCLDGSLFRERMFQNGKLVWQKKYPPSDHAGTEPTAPEKNPQVKKNNTPPSTDVKKEFDTGP